MVCGANPNIPSRVSCGVPRLRCLQPCAEQTGTQEVRWNPAHLLPFGRAQRTAANNAAVAPNPALHPRQTGGPGRFLQPPASSLQPAGLTLIELIVAMGILSLLIVLTGQAFSQVSKATSYVENSLRCNAAVGALETQLRSDLAHTTGDGLLVIAGDPNDPNVPAMLLMTATGHYVSQTDLRPGGAAVTADAALIVYILAAPVAPAAQPGSVLCRYVFLLAGDGRSPRTLAHLAAVGAGDFNALARTDVLGDSLGDVLALNIMNSPAAYILPALANRRVNIAPRDMNNLNAGGVRQLWPVMFPGCRSITWEFCDGLAADGVTPTVGASQWFSPASIACANRYGRGVIGTQRLLQRFTGYTCAVWDRGTRTIRPQSLRATVTLCGASADGPGQKYQIIVNVKQ